MKPSPSWLALPVLLWSTGARAESNWFNPKLGCGPVGAFAKSGRASDLPGCTGRLPKEAPQAEVALHDLKERLVDAEEALAKGKVDKIDALLAEVEAGLKKAPPTHPELPDRWEQAERPYREVIARLRSGKILYAQLDPIRAAYAAAIEGDRSKNNVILDGGPAEVVRLASACGDALAVVSREKIDPATPIEIDKKTTRRADELIAECARIRKDAEGKVREQEKAKKQKAKRGKSKGKKKVTK